MKRVPQFVEIKMDAEISSYQEDHDPTRDPRFVRSATPSGTRSPAPPSLHAAAALRA